MKKLTSLLLVLAMCAAMIGCGGGVDKQPAIDAYTKRLTSSTRIPTLMRRTYSTP